jgi:hypothetical protein
MEQCRCEIIYQTPQEQCDTISNELKSKLPDFEFGCFNKDIIDSSSNNH